MQQKRIIQISVVIVLVIVIYMTVRAIKNSAMGVADQSGFVQDFVTWLKKKEGGESFDKDDDASHNSWPNGSHTNRGITKTTFEHNAGKCGYSPTYSVFKAMPNSVWWCIYQEYFQKGQKYTSNVVLATYMSQWYWGGWHKPWLPESRVVAVLDSLDSDRSKLSRLIALRKEYFQKVVDNDPTDAKFQKGWNKKQDEFKSRYSKYLAA